MFPRNKYLLRIVYTTQQQQQYDLEAPFAEEVDKLFAVGSPDDSAASHSIASSGTSEDDYNFYQREGINEKKYLLSSPTV